MSAEVQPYRDLSSLGCKCGRPKHYGKSFCFACWKRLSKDLQKRLYQRTGYAEAYRDALEAIDLLPKGEG